MDTQKKIKEEVELALLALHEKIDFLRTQVDKLCAATGACKKDPPRSSPQKEIK
jgi:hypothetical protein